MSLSKKMTCKGTLRQEFYLSEAPSYDHILPHLTLNTCVHRTVYLFKQGRRGGGRANQEKVRGVIAHKGRKYQHDWLYLQFRNSIKHQWRRHLGFGVLFSSWLASFSTIPQCTLTQTHCNRIQPPPPPKPFSWHTQSHTLIIWKVFY